MSELPIQLSKKKGSCRPGLRRELRILTEEAVPHAHEGDGNRERKACILIKKPLKRCSCL